MKRILVLLIAIVLFATSVAFVANAEESLADGSQAETSAFQDLERGNQNEDVRVLQDALTSLGYSLGAVDGVFGKKTESAVMQFQRDNGFKDNGIVTREVYDAIMAKVNGSQSIENLFVDVELTEGTVLNGSNGFDFVNEDPANVFHSVSFQLFDTNWNFLQGFDAIAVNSKTYNGEYTHANETGDYILRFKVNGDTRDEYAYKTMTLEKGRTYRFEYFVDKLEPQFVSTSNVVFG